ncbi:MAG: hypothetical protein HY552_04910 [Elusimicrobia bacterium]|nr:hypothetical protein [Elusimicrobiota bacterium]
MAAIKSMPAADVDPAKSLAYNVLRHMASAIRFHGDVDRPAPRDAHEWAGERVLAEGNFNGCVEAAKVFKVLYDASNPPRRAVYVGGTRKGQDGGHAVVEITGTDGIPFLIDTSMFGRVVRIVSEAEVARPEGKTLQTGREDIHIDKKNNGYAISRWQYAHLFQAERRLGPDIEFGDLRGVNAWLAKNAVALRDFPGLKKAGIIKREDNGNFIGPGGEREYIYLKTENAPFSGTDQERIESGQRALEDKIKYGR